jgi:hypothetical protein
MLQDPLIIPFCRRSLPVTGLSTGDSYQYAKSSADLFPASEI